MAGIVSGVRIAIRTRHIYRQRITATNATGTHVLTRWIAVMTSSKIFGTACE